MLYLRTASEVQQAANAIIDRVKLTAAGAHSRAAGTEHGEPRRGTGAADCR